MEVEDSKDCYVIEEENADKGEESRENRDGIWFSWPELSAGDCKQSGGKVTFYQDGTGFFECTTWTDHTTTGDYWHASFYTIDAKGTRLFNFGVFTSPRMDPPNKYSWNATFSYPPQFFRTIERVFQNASC